MDKIIVFLAREALAATVVPAIIWLAHKADEALFPTSDYDLPDEPVFAPEEQGRMDCGLGYGDPVGDFVEDPADTLIEDGEAPEGYTYPTGVTPTLTDFERQLALIIRLYDMKDGELTDYLHSCAKSWGSVTS